MRSRSRIKPRRFGAPLARSAWVIGVLTTALLLGMAVGLPFLVPPTERGAAWLWLPAAVCGLIPLVTAFFVVRGYDVRRGEILVQRLVWRTRIPLPGLRSAVIDPDAMKRAIKTMGNGGFFCWTGWFRNKRLGAFRAFVTDPARSVVLDFGDRRLVVSPDRPEAFVAALGYPAAEVEEDA